MRNNFLALCFVGLWFLPAGLSAQQHDEAVDMGKIRMRSIRQLLKSENVRKASDYQNINTSCYHPADSLTYQTNLKTFTVNANISEVWNRYTSLSPKKAWNGKMVKFGFLYSRPANRFIYPENADDPIGVGSIIYVNLKLLKGLKNLGVAFEITGLDPATRTISFCYLEQGVTNGTQDIHFEELPDGSTKISHLTHFRSRSAFRDRELYPVFHEKLVGEFHQNVLLQFAPVL